jgi:uncharacterized protein (TIGR03437 family)
MSPRLLRTSAFALLGLLSGALSAQNVFVLPAQFGTTSATVFAADPFNQTAVLSTVGSAATFAFAGPNGKFYIVSNTSNGTVQVTDSTFANLRGIANLAGVVTAAMSPDGKRLVEIASGGLLNVIDTTTDTLTVASAYYGGQIIDIGFSLDSTKVYVLVSTAQGYQVAVADVKTGQASVTVPVSGTATGLSVGPNGIVYVSSQGAILELDPNSFATRYTITVIGRPGKLYFTPDGKTGVAVNQTPVTGTEAFIVDLASRTLTASIPSTSFNGVTLDSIVPVGNNRVLGFASQAQSLFDITLNPVNVAAFSFSGLGGVNTLTTSNNLPASGVANTQFLFFTSGSTVYRVDLNSNQITGQQSISGTAGAIQFAAPAVINGTPAALLTYGDNQNIPLKTASAPLVVKVIDAQGRPLAGVTVTFSTSSTGISFSNASSVTDAQGNAITTVTGTTPGAVTVNATAGSLTNSFTVNIASGGSGGSGGNGAGGLNLIAGQGQVVVEQSKTGFSSGSSLTVQFLDPSGKPVQGASIIFTLQSGEGTIVDSFGQSAGLTQTLTETTTTCTATSTGCTPGLASVDFLSSGVPTFPPAYTQAAITASAPNGSTVTFFISTVPQSEQAQIQLTTPSIGSTITAQSGQTLTGAIQAAVASGTGTNIPNVALSLINATDPTKPAPVMCAGGFALSNSAGIISCDLVVTATPGSYQFSINVGNARTFGPFNVVVTPGTATNIAVVSGDKQSGTPGQTLGQSLVIRVTDAAGNPSVNVPVRWVVIPAGAGTLSGVSNTTDTTGRATAVLTFSSSANGNVQVQVTAGSLPTQTFNFTVSVPISGVQLVSGGGQSAALNTAFAAPIVVKAVDSTGKGVQGVSVTFTTTNGGTVGTQTVVTDANGNASTTVTAGPTAGTITVTAQAGAFSASATLTAVPPGPVNLVFLNGATFRAGISPGAIVAIRGSGLTTIQGILDAANVVGPLPTTFQGITVTFNGIAAPIYSVSNVNGVQQVVVQVPYEVAGSSTVNVVVTNSGGGTATVSNVPVQPYAPGIFETTLFGQAQAVAIHPDGSFVSPSNPAHQGENITIFLTGLGQTNPGTGTNRAGVGGQSVAAPVVAGINNAGVPVVSVFADPGLIGVYALTLTVPSDSATGNIPVNVIAYDASNNPFFAQGSFLPIQ